MRFIGYTYRVVSELASAMTSHTENDVLIDTGSPHPRMKDGYAVAKIPEVLIDTGSPRAKMEGGCAVAKLR